MAKSKSEELDQTLEPTQDVGAVVVAPGPKKVKIQVVEDVECIIACVKHEYKKGKAYQVNSDVAAILCNSQKAYRV